MNNLAAQKSQYNAIIKQLLNVGEAKVVCVHNVDDDGDRQDLTIGKTYILKNYNADEKEFDIYSENGRSEWEEFNVDDFDRYKFFKLYVESAAEKADKKLVETKKAALEKLDTDALIEKIKAAQIELELCKEIVRARVEGVI